MGDRKEFAPSSAANFPSSNKEFGCNYPLGAFRAILAKLVEQPLLSVSVTFGSIIFTFI